MIFISRPNVQIAKIKSEKEKSLKEDIILSKYSDTKMEDMVGNMLLEEPTRS